MASELEVLMEDSQQDLTASVEQKFYNVINQTTDHSSTSGVNISDITKDLLEKESNSQLPSSTKLIDKVNSKDTDDTENDKMRNIVSDNETVIVDNEYIFENIGCESNVETNIDSVFATVETPSVKQLDCSIDQRLPETVTLLTTPDGGKLYLIGTAHFSVESQNDVSMMIQAVQPHMVVVELCKARIGLLQADEQELYRYSQNLTFQCIYNIIKEDGVYNGVLHILLLNMAARIAKDLEMAPGGEFRRAFEEAKKVPNCIIHMADRPVNITLQRALRALSWWQTIKLGWNLLTSQSNMSKEEIEMCKERSKLEKLLTTMKEEFPVLREVIVKERDIYLTYSLQLSCLPQCTSDGLVPARIVGVVGMGHVQGIIENWGKVQPSDIPPIMRIPPLSLSSKILQLSFKASLIGAVMYIGYKIIPLPSGITLQSIKSSVEGLLKDFIDLLSYLGIGLFLT